MSINQQGSICRICLRILPIQCYIFENNIKEMLEALTNKTITPQDDSSANICVPCFLQLKTAYNFQQSIIGREAMLSVKLENPKKALKSKRYQQKTDFKIEDELVVLCENPCLFCGQICGLYDEDLLINGHIRNHFEDVQTCEYCQRKFVNLECLKKHASGLKNHGVFKKLYQCEQCNATFRYISFYEEHIKMTCGTTARETKKPPQDAVVAVVEKEKTEYVKRRTTRRRKKPKLLPIVNNPMSNFKFCYICEWYIPSSKYKRHLKDHPIDQLCHLCGKVLPNMGKLKIHLQSHGKIKYKCEDCDKVFSNKFRKDAHRYRDHLNKFSHFCKKCGKGFHSLASVKKHSATHLQLREHVCEICNKKFSTRFARKVHRRKHTNETPFKCKICSEAFRYKVSLKTHLKSKHEVEDFTEYTCKTCGKEFGTDSGLHSHMRIHK